MVGYNETYWYLESIYTGTACTESPKVNVDTISASVVTSFQYYHRFTAALLLPNQPMPMLGRLVSLSGLDHQSEPICSRSRQPG